MEKGADKPVKRKKIGLIILGTIFLILLIFRLYLPTIVLKYVNKELNKIPDYRGHVDDITISLWRGAYEIQGIELSKLNGEIPVPFFSAQTMDLSLEWRALFHGSIVAKIIFIDPVINFVNGPTEAKSQLKVDKSWVQTVKALVPIRINRLEVRNGEVHYRDYSSTPKVDIYLDKMRGLATNLTNSNDETELLPAKVKIETNCLQTGTLNLQMAINPLSEKPTFELNEEMDGVNLVNLNNFLEAYAGIKVKGGEFKLYTEVASKDGNFVGYTKPFFVNLEVEKNIKENKTFLRESWAIVASTLGWVLKNHPKDQIATKIPIHGSFGKVNISIWPTIGNLLKNAFIEALLPKLDNSIYINNGMEVPASFNKLENNKKDKSEKIKSKRKENE